VDDVGVGRRVQLTAFNAAGRVANERFASPFSFPAIFGHEDNGRLSICHVEMPNVRKRAGPLAKPRANGRHGSRIEQTPPPCLGNSVS